MIARDNERCIAAALESALPWVDEAVVVDTGSQDRTAEIAQSLGARVTHFPWQDDFSLARNRSLELASSQWLFWMDTDDTLPADSGKAMRHLLASGHIADDELGVVMRVRCPGHLGRHDVTDVDHVKILRNLPQMRFEGRVHEQILPAIRRMGGRVHRSNLIVEHTHSDLSPAGQRRKIARDLRLLELEAIERPTHPFVLFNLGMTLLFAGHLDEAEHALLRCLDYSTTNESHLRKAYALLMDVRIRQGRIRDAVRTAWEGLGRIPDDLELAFKLGREHMRRQSWAEALSAFERCRHVSESEYFASVDPGIRGFKTDANIAQCYEALTDWNEAQTAWRRCLEREPEFDEAWLGLIRCARATGEVSTLTDLIDGVTEESAGRALATAARAILEGDADAAEHAFELASDRFGEHPGILDERARYCQSIGRWEDSLEFLGRLRDLDPEDPSPLFNGAVAMFRLGRLDEAADWAGRARQLRTNHPPTDGLIDAIDRQRVLPSITDSTKI